MNTSTIRPLADSELDAVTGGAEVAVPPAVRELAGLLRATYLALRLIARDRRPELES